MTIASRRLAGAALVIFTIGVTATAAAEQTTGAGRQASAGPAERGFVLGRFGMVKQHAEDGESGTATGGGASVGFFVTPRWAVELEVWVPQFISAHGKQFRDVLFSGSAVRFLGRERVRAHLLIGVAVARVESKTASGDYSNSYSYTQVGGGVTVRIAGRFALATEVRADLALTAILVRPSAGLVYSF